MKHRFGKTALGLAALLAGALGTAAETRVEFKSPNLTPAPDGFVWTSDGKSLKSEPIPVDTARNYVLSGEFKPVGKVGSFSFGLELLREDKRVIQPHSVFAIPGTETKLVKDVSKGDTAIHVKDASNWKIANGRVAALWAKPELRDLPAQAFAFYIKSIEQTDDGWRIEFDRPITYYSPKAGVLVRQHCDNRGFAVVYRAPLKSERTIRHLIASGNRYYFDSRCWWPGARFARVYVHAEDGAKIECRRIALRPVSGSELETLREERAKKSPGPSVVRVGSTAWPEGAIKTTGKNSFTWTSAGKALMSEPIPVDPSRSYLLTGNIKPVGDVRKFSFGLRILKADRQIIHQHQVCAISGTETKLVKDAAKGDTAIYVEDASKWKTSNGRVVALDVLPELKDLPASRFAFYIKSVEQTGDGWRIEFDRPIAYNAKAGVLVRQHSDNRGFSLAYQTVLKGERKFRHLISPGSRFHFDSRCWWPGTSFVRIYLEAPEGTKVDCSNVELRQLNEKEAAVLQQQQAARGVSVRRFGKSAPTGFDDEITAAPGSGFYIDGLSWPIADIRQIEMKIRSSRPGSLVLTWKQEGAARPFRFVGNQNVIPDGKFHWRIFDVEPLANNSGSVSRLYMAWRSEFPADIEISGVNMRTRNNLVPGAGMIEPGKPIALDYLLPRTKYRLRWVDGNNPGMTVTTFDRHGRKLDTFAVPAGKQDSEIAMSEKAVHAELAVAAAVPGYPELTPVPPVSAQRWRGKWIWNQVESGPEWTNIWFEREFDIDGKVEQAALAVAADDHPWIYINGEAVGNRGSYVSAECYDVAKFLRPGKNVVTVRVLNGIQNGGLVCDLYYRADGKDHYVCSGPEWKLRIGGETRPEKIDSPVVVVGDPATTAPWAGRLDYRCAGPRGIWKILSTTPDGFTAEELAPAPELPRFLRAKAVSEDGKERELRLDAKVERGGGKVTLTYHPLFPMSDKPQKLYLTDDKLIIEGDVPVGEIPAAPEAPGFRKARYVGVGERPFIELDGKKYDPMFISFHTSIRANPAGQSEVIAEMRDSGSCNYVLHTDFPDFWLGPDKYDFSKIDARAGALLDVCPDAILLLQVGCWMPEWWLKANPDDVTAHANNSPLGALESQALSSKKWLRDSEAPLKALVEHLKKSAYGHKIWGTSVSENRNWEWFWTTRDRDGKYAVSGYSPADLATFREMLRRKYGTNEKLAAAWKDPLVTFDTAQMPPEEEHVKGRVGSLLDPERDRRLMDWFEYRNLSLAEAVIHLCRTLKEASGNNWLAGAYYGYFIEMAVNKGRPVHDHGHNGYLETAKSPYVDFVRAPSRYDLRKIGLADGIMHPQDTYSLRGKVVYIECDHRTAYRKINGPVSGYVAHPVSGNETVAVLDRAFGMTLATGCAHYLYDITRGAFREPVLLDMLKEQNELYRTLPPVQGLTPCEIAVVADRDSSYYTMRNSRSGVMPAIFEPLMWNLNRLGAPVRVLSVDDLLDGLAPASRFYIMANAFTLTKEQREKLMARFDAEKATVLWLYAPGAFYPEAGPRAEFCGDFLGLRVSMSDKVQQPVLKVLPPLPECAFPAGGDAFAPWFYPESGYDQVLANDGEGRPVLVSLKRGGARHLFSTLPALPVELLRYFAAKAGAHLYTPDANDQLWIGNDVLFIHTVKGGKKTLILPTGTRLKGIIGPLKGRELVSGTPWEAEACRTYGFLLTK